MRFGILGPLAVSSDDGRPVRVPEAKVRTLLAVLLVHEGAPVSADRLADDLWGDRLPGNPVNTLQTKVSQLRRALERGEPGSGGALVHQAPGYVLRTGPEAVDAGRFRALTAAASTAEDPRSKADLLTEALALWRGPTLAEFADEAFAQPVLQRLEEDRLAAQENLADARLALGEHAALTAELADLVRQHPLRERLRALQLRALYAAGRQSEALASYDELRRLLADELGLDPGPELTALHRSILAQDPALTAVVPQLPVPLTELVGRTAATKAVSTLVRESRLVTLTGPGGVGKTRLALETAHRLGGDFAAGAWLVELTGMDRHECALSQCPPIEWVVEAIAATLGIRDAAAPAQADPVQRLAESLRGKETLIVLDNCEQLIEPVAATAARLLAAAPGLRILATSREPLGLAGETQFPVPPLDHDSAAQLFAARVADTGFTVDSADAAAVAEICRKLDGLPLALELAATRVRALGVPELLRRLDDRFRLLDTARRGMPARQQTLRALIDWSWELLSEPERLVLQRLSVHTEDCSLDAAEAVCAGDGVEEGEVLGLLAKLVDRSLVVPANTGAPRYRLLESVAVYGLERLREAGAVEMTRRRHAEYYVALAGTADAGLRAPDQRRWLQRLDADLPNLRAAAENLAGWGSANDALRLANRLAWYRFLRGRTAEAMRSLRAALSLPGGDADLRAEAQATLTALGILAGDRPDWRPVAELPASARAKWFIGYALSTVADLAGAEPLTLDALAAFEAVDDRWGIAAASGDRASQALSRGDVAGAWRYADRCAELFAEIGDKWGQLQAIFARGALSSLAGNYARAEEVHVEGLRIAEELGLWPEASYQLSWLGRVSLLRKDYAAARELHDRAREVAAEHGFTPGEMYALTGLALGARREGDLDLAERHLRTLLEWNKQVDFEPGNTLILAELGFAAELRGDPDTALRRQQEGYEIAHRTGDPRAIALALEGLAGAHALAGAPREAARLLGAAAAARAGVGAPLPAAERGDVDRITARASEVLGAAEFAAEFHAGGARGFSEDRPLVPVPGRLLESVRGPQQP
ncbi:MULTISPECIES: BTAD domain-containing putative transcriptional regulator [Amycolatopsis]|uniref:AfsR/SARP family transcriptional regulator n=1 Tax=Amycolatopsis dendrobii TaxID=2760662 RepID=A0A7W3W351_9PSEU|nr:MULTISPECIES: BTAD domain-containing putative transcriptional regulator [Amycolatopsis]MBB1157477.1 AfsR/SARP family transcriptional regulator [Amycolatopsis dendrobii]UKD59131.1 NB-ARC domain-containing protein [Amycolatopsis sp. FU40]